MDKNLKMNTNSRAHQNYHSVHPNLPAIKIGVIGASNPNHEILKIAEEVGRLIAKNNAILVCGGLGGVMELACKGAKEENGITIGILPSKDKNDANPYVDIAIPTGLGEARNLIVVLSSDALIAIDGAYGTLSEIAMGLYQKLPMRFLIISQYLE
jgi:hypothetical protein